LRACQLSPVLPRYPVDLLQMPLYLPRRHPPRVQRQNLVVESCETPRVQHDLRLEAPVAVPRHLDLSFSEVTLQLLPAGAIPRISAAPARRIAFLIP
jgi:hypothetical protein